MSKIEVLSKKITEEEETIRIIQRQIRGYNLSLRQAIIEEDTVNIVHYRDRIKTSDKALKVHKDSLKKNKEEYKRIQGQK
jgi:hypothetical protein